MQGSFAADTGRRGRGCPTAHPVARMRLLPHETVRVAGRGPTGAALHVRVRSEDLSVLQTIAVGGWLQHTVPDITVLVSTQDTGERLELGPYETCTLQVPHLRGSQETRAGDGQPAKARKRGEPAFTPLPLPVAGMHMLPGKGSSLARRAIVTLRLDG